MSPYISRGAISTSDVWQHLKTLGLKWFEVERLVQELAWRDFFQEVYKAKNESIFSDIFQPQHFVENHQIPSAVIKGETGIEVLDKAIAQLYNSGYIHNHLRMYLASICCNIAHCHWREPAQWMYYNLLDGDLASNHLSWQWVAGSFSKKKYFANQDNFNKYFNSNQKGTFLDVDYSEFDNLQTPEILQATEDLELKTKLPATVNPVLENRKTLVSNYYNLDFDWHSTQNYQRVFLLEPSFFERFPVSDKSLNFAIELSGNIPNVKLFVGEFSDLNKVISTENIVYKEHPTNAHYKGTLEQRKTLTNIHGDFSSFFNFWKKVKNVLQKEFETR